MYISGQWHPKPAQIPTRSNLQHNYPGLFIVALCVLHLYGTCTVQQRQAGRCISWCAFFCLPLLYNTLPVPENAGAGINIVDILSARY
jgi:hypothetical protein